ncbi:DegQ family serine endoprotease [Stenotrophomonas sp. W1S232]|uniref:Probable periplasmic serine endoprotease DegP-like n=1 Tax=Stenotrophomonas koreensis TaxID=266128 RepID=A0A7W3YVJ7_9GAMM|nr:DegQ family serine endoprotease [Stenotrophomonas koreensis]MBB1117003.1 DegQ family serine endoprotease [Stenotrophomonas koreensis]
MNPITLRPRALPLSCLLALCLPLSACAKPAEPSAQAAAPIATPAAPAAPLVAGLPDFTQLVDRVGPAVVNIETTIVRSRQARRNGPDMDQMPEFFRRFFGPEFGFPAPGGEGGAPEIRGRGMGSGFIISADGYVLTNHHVIDGAAEVKVKLPDRREFTATVVGSDAQYDVALLKVDAKDLPVLAIGDSNRLKPGQWVVAIGSPFGLDHSVTAGIVSAVGRSTSAEQRYVPFIQTDVAINQGNSGGPLLDVSGQVVGINSQIFSASGGFMGISFAIPIDLAMSAVEQIRSTGKVSRGSLGVSVGAVSSEMVQGFGLPDSRGALVNEVVAGSAAAKAGLEAGDVIRAVNGVAVDSASDLPPRIGLLSPGSKVELEVLREGRPRKFTATLGVLEEDAQRPANGGEQAARPATPQSGTVALLGLDVVELTDAQRRQAGLEAGQGVRIAQVSGDAARQARLTPGMIILQVGRNKVGSVAELNRQLAGYKKDDVIMLLVRAGGANAFVAVKAG